MTLEEIVRLSLDSRHPLDLTLPPEEWDQFMEDVTAVRRIEDLSERVTLGPPGSEQGPITITTDHGTIVVHKEIQ